MFRNLIKESFIDIKNDKGQTLLSVAAQHGNLDIIKELIKFEADKDINTSDNNGKTALENACERLGGQEDKQEEIIAYLVTHGAIITETDYPRLTEYVKQELKAAQALQKSELKKRANILTNPL